jgi:predicted aldo/keto reductase-like oxidoreductase
MAIFPEVKKRFGFGCMRLPMDGGQVDLNQTCAMVDCFMERGFNYFDTAHGYISGHSETAVRTGLVSRYPRESYILANKLSDGYFNTAGDIRPLFEAQLTACGVDYFDFYLFHALNNTLYRRYTMCHAFEIVQQLKTEGKICHVGMSFHDTADVLDCILTDHPEIEVVQLQFNYLDFDDPKVQSRACYEVCERHNKPIIVMEPMRGGKLADLPPEAAQILDGLGGGSCASYALRFCAQFPNVRMILSGMSSMEMLEDNTATMSAPTELNGVEQAALEDIRAILIGENTIPCTACCYCVDCCPRGIPIPALFALYNARKRGKECASCTQEWKKASYCIGCGKCELACPQNLMIRDLLLQISDI